MVIAVVVEVGGDARGDDYDDEDAARDWLVWVRRDQPVLGVF